MVLVSEHPFEVPSTDAPKPFSGFVCIGNAAGRWFCGCDTINATDAYDDMGEDSRAKLALAVAVDKRIDPSIPPHLVTMFRVERDVPVEIVAFDGERG